jgi:predicted amidophosphoribosyltransferase
MPEQPVKLCGACGEHYAMDTQRCAHCDTTLIVWRPKSEAEANARRWWSIVNWGRLNFAHRPILEESANGSQPKQAARAKTTNLGGSGNGSVSAEG